MPKGTASGFGCGEDGNKVRDFPTRDGKNVAPNVPKDNVVNKGHFYAIQTTGAKLGKGYEDDGNFLYFSL